MNHDTDLHFTGVRNCVRKLLGRACRWAAYTVSQIISDLGTLLQVFLLRRRF